MGEKSIMLLSIIIIYERSMPTPIKGIKNQNTTHENQKCRLKNCLCLPNTINYHQSSFYVTTYYNILTNWNKNLRSVYSTKIESIKIEYSRPTDNNSWCK